MKKGIIMGLVVLLTTAVVSVAIARGPGQCFKGPGAGTSMTQEQAQKFARFQTDTLPLRQKMMQLRTELMSLRVQEKPDWKAIAGKQKEMVDLRVEMQKRASEAGIAGFGPGFGRGRGMGSGCDDCFMEGKGPMGMGRM